MSYKIGDRVKFRNQKVLGTVVMSNACETLVKFDDDDKCAVDTEYLQVA